MVQVVLVDIAGDVLTAEARRIKLRYAGISLMRGRNKVLEILEDQAVGTDDSCDLRLVAPVCHKLMH